MSNNRQIIKSEAAQLINALESLEAFAKVARQHATELYDKIGYGTELVQRDRSVAAYELIRLATDCQLSAARIDLLIDLEIKPTH